MASHKLSGFTLFELLIVLALLGLFSALAWPSMAGLIHRAKTHRAAYELYHLLQFSRTQALVQRSPVTLCASDDGQFCKNSNDWSYATVLVFQDDNRNGLREANEVILRLSAFTHEGHLYWQSFGNKAYIQWRANGMTYYQNGHFLYCPANGNEQHAFRLVLNVAGRAYFAEDSDHDGIVEASDGQNILCP